VKFYAHTLELKFIRNELINRVTMKKSIQEHDKYYEKLLCFCMDIRMILNCYLWLINIF